ncbi:MAG: glycoside hydrolase family 140 protein [Synoicihabitans sp.]
MTTIVRLLGFMLLASGLNAQPLPPVQVSESGTHLESANGETFIWLGDTAWELFHKLTREETIEYLDNRAAKGFTVIQAVVLAELNGLRTPNAYGHLPLHDLDPARPNEAYFEHVDFVIDAASRRGLVIGLLPTWGDKVPSKSPSPGPEVFTPENAAIFGAFLGSRYADRPLVWILGGDRDPDVGNATEIWHAMGHAIKQATDGGQLMTYHPRGWSTSARFFHDAHWLDFNMFQSGHQIGIVPMGRLTEETQLQKPSKPFINGEPAYEDIAIRFWDYMDFSKPGPQRVPAGVLNEQGLIVDPAHFAEGFVTASDVRRQAYMTYLLGAAGYTYGNNAIWQMYRIGGDIALPTLTDWREALDRPGARAMRHVRSFLESRPIGRLRPTPEAIHAAPEPRNRYPVLVGYATDGSYLIAHLPHGGEIAIKGSYFPKTPLLAWWFNPRDGSAQRAIVSREKETNLIHASSPTEDEDWLLVLDAPGTEFPAPGQGK